MEEMVLWGQGLDGDQILWVQVYPGIWRRGQFGGEGEDDGVGWFGWNAVYEPKVLHIPRQSDKLAEYGSVV